MILGDVVVCARNFFEANRESENSPCISKAIHQSLAATAASSAKSMSLIIVCFTFALKREGLNRFPSARVCRYIPASAVPKICLRSSETGITKNSGASTQRCL